MSDDLKAEFERYRDAAMKVNRSRLGEGAFPSIDGLLSEAWPEAARARELDDRCLRFREVERGHDAGQALCLLGYDVGNDELGWRRFRLEWTDDAGWSWEAVARDDR